MTGPEHAAAWRTILHPDGDPAAGVIPGPADVQGWGSDAGVFRAVLRALAGQNHPIRILELGTWKGASAIHMTETALDLGLDPAVLCVDTWLGSREMVGVPSGHESRGLRRVCGWPQVYHRCLDNVILSGHADRIVLWPQTTAIALRWMLEAGWRFDLVYVDASHDGADVYDDCCGAWEVLAPGGILLGDDWSAAWPEVGNAVGAFMETMTDLGNGRAVHRDGPHWWMTR